MHQPSDPSVDPARSPSMSRRQLLALAGGAVVVTACGGGASSAPPSSSTTTSTTPSTTAAPRTTTTKASTTTSPTSTTVAPTTTTLPPPVQPLTGLPLGDETLLAKPAVIVKVSNDPGARPQTGLNEADIVYEAWGAGPTRFGAVYHSRDDDFVGPIRSCRSQDVDLFGSFNRAVFACSGGNPGNVALLRNSDMLLITEGQGPGWSLDPHRGRPHKTHGDTALFRTNAEPDRTAPLQQFPYRAAGEAATVGEPMTGFDLQMQQVFMEWRYDPAYGTYWRSQAGRPHLMADGTQVTSENVAIAWLDYNSSSTDSRSPDGTSTGSNGAVVFTGGRVILGTWTRDDRLQPFTFKDPDGQPILFAPGRTFVELANSGNGRFPGSDELTLVP